MKIGFIQKTTLIDYPGKVAATIFVSGCNFRCRFCYNKDLVEDNVDAISEKEVFKFLESRKGLLEAIVICGGEPTIHQDLPEFISKIKKLGFLVKLDTNGTNLDILKKVDVDYIAMDIKAPNDKYKEITGLDCDVQEAINWIKESGIDYEFRTTLVPGLVEKKEILDIAKWISPAKRYIIQNFIAQDTIIDENLRDKKSFEDQYLQDIVDEIKDLFDEVKFR
jgi:pyruvate formate lyase activating enzyme